MKRFLININGESYARLPKAKARKAYVQGEQVVICACKLRPDSPFATKAVLSRKEREGYVKDETGVLNDFDNQVASFEYYNCSSYETGYYANYYIRSDNCFL